MRTPSTVAIHHSCFSREKRRKEREKEEKKTKKGKKGTTFFPHFFANPLLWEKEKEPGKKRGEKKKEKKKPKPSESARRSVFVCFIDEKKEREKKSEKKKREEGKGPEWNFFFACRA